MKLVPLLLPIIIGIYHLKGSIESSSGGVGLYSTHFHSSFASGTTVNGKSGSSHYQERAGIPYYFNIFYLIPGVNESVNVPIVSSGLKNLWPNPSMGKIVILYGAHKGDRVKIQIFSISGREVYRKLFVEHSDGIKTLRVDRNLPSGIYILHFKVEDNITSRKIVVIK